MASASISGVRNDTSASDEDLSRTSHFSSSQKNTQSYGDSLLFTKHARDRPTDVMFPTVNHITHRSSGFPTGGSAPLAHNLTTDKSYLNLAQIPDNIQNIPLSNIKDQNLFNYFSRIAPCIVPLCEKINGEAHIIGTAVLIAPKIAIVAKHCISNRNGRLQLYVDQTFIDLDFVNFDPCLDIALVSLKGQSNFNGVFPKPYFESQPRGAAFMLHYASGKLLQISTGNFEDSNYSMIQHRIFITGGPAASGAGIFDANGRLIGINLSRGNEHGAQYRNIALLSQSDLLYKNSLLFTLPPFIVNNFVHNLNFTNHLNLYSVAQQNAMVNGLLPDGLEGNFTNEQLLAMTPDQINIYVRDKVLSIYDIQRRERLILHKNKGIKLLLQKFRTSAPANPFTEKFRRDHIYLGNGQLGSITNHSVNTALTRSFGSVGMHKRSSSIEMTEEDGRAEVLRIANLFLNEENIAKAIEHKRNEIPGCYLTSNSYKGRTEMVNVNSRGSAQLLNGSADSGRVSMGLKIEDGELRINHLSTISVERGPDINWKNSSMLEKKRFR